jgi:signal transduction histidine kinase
MKNSRLDGVIDKIDPFLPRAFRVGRMPYVFVLVLILILAMVATTLVTPYKNGAPVPLAFAVVLLLLLLAISRGMPILTAVHVALLAATIQVTYAGWVSGGIFSPRLSWFTLIPLIPFYVVSKRAGFFWLVVVLSMLLGLTWVTWLGWLPENPTIGLDQARSSFASNTVSMLLAISVIFLYDNLYRKAYSERVKRKQQLELKQQELLRAAVLREQFIATVSHELRTPMNAILGFNDILLARVKDQPQALSILNHTRQSADHLMTVINDVLDNSQLQAGKIKIQYETFDLHDTVRNAFSLFRPRVESMHLLYRCEIDEDVPRWVNTDRHRLMQVLVNLLGNAIKFTHQGHVILRVQKDKDGVVFRVDDTGIGIAENQKARIFQRYVQADHDIQSRYGGTGLGLSITQRLVQLMEGRIGFESVVGKGSNFWFVLPLTAHDAPTGVPSVNREKKVIGLEALHFLVADDHPINRLLIKKVLTNAWPSAQVAEAENGLEALEALRTQAFDMVFMDMVMPEMDGIEAVHALRTQLPLPARSTPVLGLTANVSPQDLERFKDAGLNAVMLKPFEAAQLCEQVAYWLTSRKSSPGS